LHSDDDAAMVDGAFMELDERSPLKELKLTASYRPPQVTRYAAPLNNRVGVEIRMSVCRSRVTGRGHYVRNSPERVTFELPKYKEVIYK